MYEVSLTFSLRMDTVRIMQKGGFKFLYPQKNTPVSRISPAASNMRNSLSGPAMALVAANNTAADEDVAETMA